MLEKWFIDLDLLCYYKPSCVVLILYSNRFGVVTISYMTLGLEVLENFSLREKSLQIQKSDFFCILPPKYITFGTLFAFNTYPWRYGKWSHSKKWAYPKTGHFGTFLSKSGISFGLRVQTTARLRSARHFGSVCGPPKGVGCIVRPLETVQKVVFRPRRRPNRTPPTWGDERSFSGNNQPPTSPCGRRGGWLHKLVKTNHTWHILEQNIVILATQKVQNGSEWSKIVKNSVFF